MKYIEKLAVYSPSYICDISIQLQYWFLMLYMMDGLLYSTCSWGQFFSNIILDMKARQQFVRYVLSMKFEGYSEKFIIMPSGFI